MDPWPREFDQRKSYRCPLPEGRRAAELRVRRRRIPAELFNESSGGFAALVDADPKLEVDERVELLSDCGCIEVRVAYVTRLDADPAGAPGAAGSYRVGLERLSDLGPGVGRPAAAGTRAAPAGRSAPGGPGVAGVVGAILLIVAAAICGLAIISYWAGRPQAAPVRLAPQKAAGVEPPAAGARQGLTPGEHGRARSLARQTANVLAELDAQWRSAPPEQRVQKRQQFVEAIRRETLDRLEPEARLQWAALFGATGQDEVVAASQRGEPAP